MGTSPRAPAGTRPCSEGIPTDEPEGTLSHPNGSNTYAVRVFKNH